MATTDIFTETTQKEIRDEVRIVSGLTKIIAEGWKLDSWAAIQEMVRSGAAARWIPVGTQLNVADSVYGTRVFDVVAHDFYKNPADEKAHTMALLSHDVLMNCCVDETEALYAVSADVWPDGMPAGTYNFTLLAGYDTEYGGGKTYSFTTTQTVPVGGVLDLPWRYNTQVASLKISSYADQATNTALESMSLSEASDGTSLGTADGNSAHMNHSHCIRYGCNNWEDSAIRQWLNSAGAKGTWWSPRCEFDRQYGQYSAYYNMHGHMYGLDPEFLAVLGEVDIVTLTNQVYNHGKANSTIVTTRDKFFLPSRVEMGCGEEGSGSAATGESVWPYYDGATETDRIKYNSGSARGWWVRSPNYWNASTTRVFNPSGALSNSNAYNTNGAAAACVIM